ncbi:MAG: prolyl oligopeptidase family serine peptidase [Terracidiphilus sp.]|jgi:pimeloyl-ACP methyl ester carboxylesterase
MENHPALLLVPDEASSTEPLSWVWFAPMVHGQPNVNHTYILQHVLGSGMAFASINVGESYGSVEGTRLYAEFHDLLTRCFHLSTKAVLFPQSRGGLMLFNWATLHPDEVLRIAGIYPVCNLSSYPGLKVAAKAYSMTEEQLTAELSQHNPLDLLASLAKADVPVLLMHGDVDKVVPIQDNSAEFVRRYLKLGGHATLVVIPGKGHQEADEFFKSPQFVAFLTTGK